MGRGDNAYQDQDFLIWGVRKREMDPTSNTKAHLLQFTISLPMQKQVISELRVLTATSLTSGLMWRRGLQKGVRDPQGGPQSNYRVSAKSLWWGTLAENGRSTSSQCLALWAFRSIFGENRRGKRSSDWILRVSMVHWNKIHVWHESNILEQIYEV